MVIIEADQRESWNTDRLIEEFHHNLTTIRGEDGLRKYEERARFLLYRIPVWKDPTTGNPSRFIIEIKDITEEVKEQIANVSDFQLLRAIVKETVSLLFENLGHKEKEYFNKSVRHLLRVRFV